MALETIETLAVRYRPRTLDNVIGQDDVINMLKGMFRSNKVNKSFLISGPSGIGKTSLARIIANYVNCENFDYNKVEICGKCAYCQSVARGDYVDVEEINFANTRGIDTVRAVIDSLQYEPMCNAKIFILDEAHRMTQDAQAAFLKPVEEPPRGVIFLFLTTEPHKLMDTIRNRCTKLILQKPAEDELVSYLIQIAANENRDNLPVPLFKQIAIASRGHIRQALSFLEMIFYAIEGDPNFNPSDFDKVSDLIGKNLEESEVTIGQYLIEGIYRGKYAPSLMAAKALIENKSSNPRRFFENVASLHTQTLYLMIDPKGNYPKLFDEYYGNWKTSIVAEAQKGAFKVTVTSATKITAILLELMDRLAAYDFDISQLVTAFTIRMVQAVQESVQDAYTKNSPFHRTYAPEMLVEK